MTAHENTGIAAPGASTRPATGVRRSTGRERDEWFAALDARGEASHGYRDRVDWLTTEHGLSAWWAQKLVVEYEQARGLRIPGARPDGTFTVTASKAVSVPVERLVDAFLEADLRERWLPGLRLRERTVRAGRSARFDVNDAARVAVTFANTGDGRSQAAIEHAKLPDPRTAHEAKAFWHDRSGRRPQARSWWTSDQ
jgi:hypothetical protein